MKALLFCTLLAVSTAAVAQIEIHQPWSRATAPGAKVAAGYMHIRNNAGAADRLVGASSPAAGRIETHVTVKDGEVLRMRELKGYEIPAKGGYELKPGGAHLMLMELKQPFKDGEKIPVTLRFEKAGEIKTELSVQRAAPAASGHHKH